MEVLMGTETVEIDHLTFNQVVGGSNPPCFTKKRDLFQVSFLLL